MALNKRPTRSKPPRRLSNLTNEQPSNTLGIVIVLDTWGRLQRHAPDPERSVSYYTNRSGIPFAEIEHLRLVRNCCAHPEEGGWPQPQDLNRALGTAYALRELTVGLPLT